MIALLSWFYVLLWASLIFYLSSIPSLDTGLGLWDFILRKGAHIFEFLILTLLIFRAWKKSLHGFTFIRFVLMGSLPALLYAASDEYHQSFVCNRCGTRASAWS